MVESHPERHHFDRPIKRVAIVGGGPAGVPAARQLRDAGLEVRVFERQNEVGGVWNWNPAVTRPLSVPTPPPSIGAFTPTIRNDQTIEDPNKSERHRFNPPNPCYWNLTNNVPTTTMAFKDFPYPPGTEPNISHTLISDYVHEYWEHFGLSAVTSLNTRVERAVKKDGEWNLTLRKVEDAGEDKAKETYWNESFDAVLVATGHYNAPYIPALRGVGEWFAQWPEKIQHTQGYRTSEPYKGKTVLIVGIGTSGIDIARDISPDVERVIMVGRNELYGPESYQAIRRLQRFLVPQNGERVAEIKEFRPPVKGTGIESGEIELTDGRIISGIDAILFATGYQYSFPFLPELHQDPGAEANPSLADPLITDGNGVRNLYRDVFYLPDPTLSFIGLSVNTSAFSFFEYQSISIARVYSEKAFLPNEEARRERYKQLVAEKGQGKFTHLLGQQGERAYVKETVEWINRDAAETGAAPIEGHTDEWLAESDKTHARIAARYGLSDEVIAQIRGQAPAAVERSVLDPPPAGLESDEASKPSVAA